MASSADSVHSDSDAIGIGARTPTHLVQPSSAAAAAAAASELSPPGSQSQHIPDISAVNDFRNIELGSNQAYSREPEPPIAEWKSKRAQEEFQRAMEKVVDRDFNLSSCIFLGIKDRL